MPVNPYIAGNPVGGGDAFVGRADVLRDVARVLRSPSENALVLFGQRRIGKTSILQELKTRLPELGPYQPVYFDLQGKAVASLQELLADLARQWGLSTDGEFLPQLLEHLPPQTSLVILLDEYGLLDNRAGNQVDESMFIFLRDLINLDPDRLQFIFVSGQRPEDMPSLALSIFKGIKSRPVSLLSKSETTELIRLAVRNKSLKWSPDTIDYVYSLTGGHPFLTQQLCQEVWETAYYDDPAKTPAVTIDNIEKAVPYAMRSSANALEWVWDGLGPAERVVASALARNGPGQTTESQFSRALKTSGVRVLVGPLQEALHILNEWDLIDITDTGYFFKVELLRRWIANRKTLGQLQDEVSQLEPVAANMFREAYTHYQHGSLDLAVPLLRQAIALNPNHLQANQLLAEILLAQGEVYKARQMLENLVEYQPATQPRLVQALLLQARESGDDDRLNLYNRALQLDPHQSEALTGRRRIWLQRGDEALAAGNSKEALSAYRQADVPEKIVTAGLQQISNLEQSGRHLAALDMAEQLYAEFPSQRNNFPPLFHAEILLNRGEVVAAQQKLEKLYDDQPEAAGPILIKVLLTQVKRTGNDDERLGFYEKVLQVQPDHPLAIDGLRQIWGKRGDAAREAGNLEEALDAYQRAGLNEQAQAAEQNLRRLHFTVGLQEIAELEETERFDAALKLAETLHQTYPEYQAELSNLAQLRQKVQLDDLYSQALTAFRKNDRQTAETLFAQVVARQPGFRDSTRYLHLVVSGVDVAELLSELEEEQKAMQEFKVTIKTETSKRSKLESRLTELEEMLQAEKVSRQETEAFAQREASALRQREKELEQIRNRWETEKVSRQEFETKTREEMETYRRLESELAQYQELIEAEKKARQEAALLARQEAQNRQKYEQENERLKAALDAEKKDALQKAKFAAVRTRMELQSEAGQIQQYVVTRHKQKLLLSSWNPWDYVRLLWWIFMDVPRVKAYKKQFGIQKLHRRGKWAASMLVWLPLIFPTLALGLGTLPASRDAWPPETYLWLSAGLIVVWLLSGWLGDSDDVPLNFALIIISFTVAVSAVSAVAVGLSPTILNDWVIGLTIGIALFVAIGVTFIVQGAQLKLGTVVTIGVAVIVLVMGLVIRVSYVISNIIIDVPISVAGGLVGCLASSLGIGLVVWVGERLFQQNNKWFIALFGMFIIGVPGILAGVVAGFISGDTLIGTNVGMALSLANALALGIFMTFGTLLKDNGFLQRKNYTVWLARGSFGVLLVAYVVIVWHAFLGGWQTINLSPSESGISMSTSVSGQKNLQ
jgi:hypothetical protein